jgi:hypothetical protein
LYREIDEYQIEIADQDSYFIRTETISSTKLQVNTDVLLFYYRFLKRELTAPPRVMVIVFNTISTIFQLYCGGQFN